MRDVFELVTPGTEQLYALGFRIFGVHSWVIAAAACLSKAIKMSFPLNILKTGDALRSMWDGCTPLCNSRRPYDSFWPMHGGVVRETSGIY
jgi:hypothetical protein